MRPNFIQVLGALALITSTTALSQDGHQGLPAPTIHTSPQHLAAVPLPPLSANTGPNNTGPNNTGQTSYHQDQQSPGYSSNASWLGGASSQAAPGTLQASGASQVVTAAAIEPLANSIAETRTRLDPPSAKASPTADRSSSGSTLKMMLSVGSSLLIVIGLFLGVAWFARKTMNATFGGLPKQVVSILGRTPLAPRQQLVLVRFGSKLVLVSMIQGEARTISEITDPLEVDQLAGLCESSQPGSITSSFRSVLQQAGGGAV
jgi:flagellar protein FliO/FliZ